jgi:biopolymer transport protein ExbD
MQKIDELFNLLKNKRELWKQVQPNKPFPGVVVLQVDQEVPALVVKSVFQTAAFAGYPNVSFMVGKLAKSN